MARISKTKIDEAANKWAKGVIRDVRKALTREKGISTKKLWNSIRYRYANGVITFSMEEYGAYLDAGVSGTGKLHYRGGSWMPVAYNKSEHQPEFKFKSSKKAIGGSVKRWLQTKGLPESLDFVVRRSVHARGIRPRRFFSDPFRNNLPQLNVELGEAATAAINDTLDEILEPLKN